MKKVGLFAAGVLFGTAGIKLLGSKDAKKVYAHTTAAALLSLIHISEPTRLRYVSRMPSSA